MGKGTPCGECPKPTLMASNYAAWEIFIHLSTQVRVGGLGGFAGIDYASLPALFNVFGVRPEEQIFYLDKIRILSEALFKHSKKGTDDKG
jgi:hypothetical protein